MIVGSGYVGLVSGACFADIGHEVICIDKDAGKIAALREGRIPIYEPGLDDLIARNVAAGRLRFETGMDSLDPTVEAVFMAVGTPPKVIDTSADLSAVYAVSREIALRGVASVLVTKSTVPVGTGDEVEAIIRSVDPDLKISVASNPEFLREGNAIGDFMKPDRIVLGVEDERARDVLERLYAPLTDAGAPLLTMRRRAAELVKYAANTFLATKITFINEMANLCEVVGVDALDVSQGIGLDRRIGASFLQPGPGYGGSCFPKDCNALVSTARAHHVELTVVESAISSNNGRRRLIAERIIAALGDDVRGKSVAMLGLTFKANTDDLRDTPAVPIIEALKEAGLRVVAYDPQGMESAAKTLVGVEMAPSALACCADADCIVVATEWPEFRTLDAKAAAGLVRGKLVCDLRNIIDADAFVDAGFVVHGVGRPVRTPDLPIAREIDAYAPQPSSLPGAAARANPPMRPAAPGLQMAASGVAR